MTEHLHQLIKAHPRLGAKNASVRRGRMDPGLYTTDAQKKRNELIRTMGKLLPRLPDSQRAEVIFRLAELFWQTGQYWYRQEYGAFEMRLQAWVDGGSDPRKRPQLKTPKATTFRKQAIRNYEAILTKYPRYPRRDHVLAVTADHLYASGKKTGAVRSYVELVKKYPKSQFAPGAYLALGEHFLTSKMTSKATKSFERAKRTRDEDTLLLAEWGLCRTLSETIDREGCLAPLIGRVEALSEATQRERASKSLPAPTPRKSESDAPKKDSSGSGMGVVMERVDATDSKGPRAGGVAASCQSVPVNLWSGLLLGSLFWRGRRRALGGA